MNNYPKCVKYQGLFIVLDNIIFVQKIDSFITHQYEYDMITGPTYLEVKDKTPYKIELTQIIENSFKATTFQHSDESERDEIYNFLKQFENCEDILEIIKKEK